MQLGLLNLYKKILKKDTPQLTYISDVNSGILFNVDLLTSFALRRFIWKNLPSTIDSYILEKTLIEYGGVIPVEKNNDLWLMPLNSYGVGVYKDEPPKGIYANPILGSETFNLNWYNTDNVILFENSSRIDLIEIIKRYAEKLSRIESTIDIILTNNNGTDTIIAKSQNVADAIKKIYDSKKEGKIFISTTEEIADILGDSYRIIESNKKINIPTITELLTAYNNTFRLFMREIGITVSKDKSQAILSDETFNENIFPRFILNDCLDVRKNWSERMNNKYNLNISVEINPFLNFSENENKTE